MKIIKNVIQGLLFLSIVSIVYANKFVVRNDTKYPMSFSAADKTRYKNVLFTHSFQDIYPGQEATLSENHENLAGIIVTNQGAYKKIDKHILETKYLLPLNFSQPNGANYQELDRLQHRAIWDKSFSIRYGLMAGWTTYYLQPLLPYQ